MTQKICDGGFILFIEGTSQCQLKGITDGVSICEECSRARKRAQSKKRTHDKVGEKGDFQRAPVSLERVAAHSRKQTSSRCRTRSRESAEPAEEVIRNGGSTDQEEGDEEIRTQGEQRETEREREGGIGGTDMTW